MIASLLLKIVLVSVLSLESVILQLASEKKVSEGRKQFLRYVFHEVRVPLSTITMGLAVLKDDIVDTQKEVLEMMDCAAGFMNNTLNDVLSMSKIEDGDLNLTLKPFKLSFLLDSIMYSIAPKADHKGIKIIRDDVGVSLSSDSSFLVGDEAKLKHVLISFLTNAIKFSFPDSTVTLSVSVSQKNSFVQSVSSSFVNSVSGKRNFSSVSGNMKRSRVAPHMSRRSWDGVRNMRLSSIKQKISQIGSKSPTRPVLVTVLVRDSGIGIAPEVQGKLFHAFAQIRPHDKEKDGRGSGLGLVVAKRIVTLHGGKLIFESQLGKGSTFGFSIPFITSDRAYLSGRFQALESLASSIKSAAANALHLPLLLKSASSKSASKRDVRNKAQQGHGHGHGDIQGLQDRSRECSARRRHDCAGTVGTEEPLNSSVSISCLRDDTLMDDAEIRNLVAGELVQIRTVTGQLAYGQLVRSRVRSRAASGTCASESPAPKITNAGSFQGRRMRFLLVDDTASNCKMLKMLLSRKGIDSDIANDGQEAVTVFRLHPSDAGARRAAAYDVIFMDHTMPIMSGIEATSLIRSLGFTGLIIGLTGNALDDDVTAFLHAGADCVTLKPFREEHLSALLGFLNEHGCESNPRIRSVMRHTALKV
jgi:signal transduction histidine kinase/CheY-like chemotaxis protein